MSSPVKRNKKVEFNCGQCGVQKEIAPCNIRQNNFCSKKCFHLSLKGKSFSPETRFEKGKSAWNKNKKTGISPWAGKKRPEISGENHYLYIHDRSKLKTDRLQAYDARYKDWMRQVKNRDGWKCQIANKDCCGRLEAHHILGWKDHPELRYEVKNGITLCQFHHPKKKEDEKQLAQFFTNLVLISNQ